jgi:hypothetical protein
MRRLLLVLLLGTGCLGPAPRSERAALTATPDAVPTQFDINDLLSDQDVRGGQTIAEAEVQAFLQSKGSFLAGYTDPAFNQTAASLIVGQSLAEGVSPLYMLARIQTESSLVESGSSSYLDSATGCGCPDSGGCSQSYAGFGKQVECAAKTLHNYFADLDAGNATIAGWNVGVARATSDPCTVTPANKATAALYTYTPWVGAYGIGCGRSDVGGSSLVALLFNKYANEQAWGGGPPASNDPCAGLSDGSYCGGDGIGGAMGTLYLCKGGQVSSSQVCQAGCKWNPPGTPDECNPGPSFTGGDGGAGTALGPGADGGGATSGASDTPSSGAHGCSLGGAASGGLAQLAPLPLLSLLVLRRRRRSVT